MGFLRWLKSKTFGPTIIADNAAIQYRKWKDAIKQYNHARQTGESQESLKPAVIYMLEKYGEMGESPKDIAQYMWDWRYVNSILNKNDKQRYSHYLSIDFPIETVMDFCLSTSDIEFCASPSDTDYSTYWGIAEDIGKHLTDNDVPYAPDDINSFRTKWVRLIKPLR